MCAFKGIILKQNWISKFAQRSVHDQLESAGITGPKNIKRKPLSERLSQTTPVATSEWEEIQRESIHSGEVKDIGFDSRVMGLCLQNKNFVSAKSYIAYLRNIKKNVNVTTLARYIRVCGENIDYSGEDLIWKTYEEVKKKGENFDPTVNEHLIYGLAKTKYWKECLKLMESTQLLTKPSSLVYHVIAAAAFKNGEVDLGVDVLNKMSADGVVPSGYVLRNWLDKCVTIDDVHRVLDYSKNAQIIFTPEIAEEIKFKIASFEEKENWIGDFTSINDDGVCQLCDEKLNNIELSSDEFKQLKTFVLSQEATRELEDFKVFLENNPPFDLVLDGWSIATAFNTLNDNRRAKQLHNVIAELSRQETKILLLAKKRMIRWPKRYMTFAESETNVYFLNDRSFIHPFLLYAALVGGEKTLIATRNILKYENLFMKSTNLRYLFNIWRLQSQMRFKPESFENFSLQPPLKLMPVYQHSGATIHLPCVNKLGPESIASEPFKWLCLRKDNKAKVLIT